MGSSTKKFLIPFLLSLLVWYGIYDVLIKPSYVYDAVIIQAITKHSQNLLEFLGYTVTIGDNLLTGFANHITVGFSQGVVIGPGCDGLVILALFVLFILFMPGPIKHKLWYVPAGVLCLHCLNVLRVSCLAVIMNVNPEWLGFNHDYTFTLITYGFVFLLWMIWVKKFASK